MSRMSRIRLGVAAGAVLGATLLTASPALAHEVRPVGNYVLTVGWEIEPAYVGIPNAVELFVHDAKGNAVDVLGANGLKVQVIFGSLNSDQLALNLSFDSDTGLGLHGQFLAPIVPTSPGDYTFHFTGDINGQPIDQKFTSGPSTFNTVTDPAGVEFPLKNPTVSALSTSVSQLIPRVDNVRTLGTAALARAKSAKSSAGAATTLGIIALVLGIAGLAAGLALGLGGRRRAATP